MIFPRKCRKALKTVDLKMIRMAIFDEKTNKSPTKNFSPAKGTFKYDKYCILRGYY